ncbi:MAG: single-stranded DNA-binding protein [Candidatus Aureabacteria bacterium]|nr:single-stranded DNA-binding protein [Candidatus Auribacterota bacterium]
MASLNRVFLMGNLTKAPALRYTPGGAAVADLSLAINSTYVNKAGEKKDEVCYVDVVTWGRQAETAAEYLTKGSPIMVEGRLQLDSWETGEGDKRSKLRVRATRVQFLGRGKGGATRPPEAEAAEEPSSVSGPPEEIAEGGPEPEDGREGDVPF